MRIQKKTKLLPIKLKPVYTTVKSILNAGGLEPHTKFKNALVLLYKRYLVSEIVLTYFEKTLFEQLRIFFKFLAFSLEFSKKILDTRTFFSYSRLEQLL